MWTWNCSASSAKQNKNNFMFATCTKHKNQQRSESIVEVWRNYGSFSYALRCNKDHQLFFKRYFFRPWCQITQSVFLTWLEFLWLNVIVVQLHKYLLPLCIRRRFDQFLSKRKLGPILYVRSRPGLSTIPARPTELWAHWWHMHMPFP